MRILRGLSLVSLAGLLSGCNMVLLNPAGDVARQQRDILLLSTGLMLLIIIPVLVSIVVIAWKYRSTNADAVYKPEFYHSTRLEVMIWSAPLAIIIVLGALTWISTHLLDPYRPIAQISDGRPVPAGTKPLVVDVVALDWKWLFIYPEYGIATVNEMAAPVDRPISFQITSSSMMNSFYIPTLAGQIYAMPGMQTQLHAVINKPGEYVGFSANYSGAGFSDMNFKFHGLDDAGFNGWIAKVKQAGGSLDAPGYLDLAKPSEKNPVHYYGAVKPDLFGAVVNQCVEAGSLCNSDMMRIDAKGGTEPGGEIKGSDMKGMSMPHSPNGHTGDAGLQTAPGDPMPPKLSTP